MATATATPEPQILSKLIIRPSSRSGAGDDNDGSHPQVIHLTAWDLQLISSNYIQKGILFRNPHPLGDGRGQEEIIPTLLSSFSKTLDLFFPLAGRLATVKHDTSPPSLSIVLECNSEGAEFIHASALEVTVSDILDSVYIPSVVISFFPLNGKLNYEGLSFPLLAVQVTELSDGIFIGCSMNHAVVDGNSFWHFFNSWSEICRTGVAHISEPPVLDRWFLDSSPAPIRLPFSSEVEFIRRFPPGQITECALHFSAEALGKLKAEANEEMGTNRISSLQSLLGHLWRSVTRARGLDPQQETNYVLVIGSRARVNPPLPQAYLGNSLFLAVVKAKAGELLDRGLGWSAWLLNQEITSYTETVVRDKLEEWTKSPSFLYSQARTPWNLVTGSSPRFNVYGNDFGWGKPVAVRSGCANKRYGKATIYPGPEKGSMALELNLPPEVLSSLFKDTDFMELVSNA